MKNAVSTTTPRTTPGVPSRTTAQSCPGVRERRVSQPSYTWPLVPNVCGENTGGSAVTRLSAAANSSSLAATTPPPSRRDARSGSARHSFMRSPSR